MTNLLEITSILPLFPSITGNINLTIPDGYIPHSYPLSFEPDRRMIILLRRKDDDQIFLGIFYSPEPGTFEIDKLRSISY